MGGAELAPGGVFAGVSLHDYEIGGNGSVQYIVFQYLGGPLPPDLQAKPPGQAQKEVKKRLHTEVTKTIAAFLDTGGGTLLIGADDSGSSLVRYIRERWPV